MSGIANYTTSVEWRKSVSEIIGMLASARASHLMQEFDGAGNVTAVAFKIKTPHGELAFHLPCETQKAMQVLQNQYAAGKIRRGYSNDANHARNVAWRILRHWLEAQLALVEIGQVTVEQVFLPYVQNSEGKTLYEVMLANRFQQYTLCERSES